MLALLLTPDLMTASKVEGAAKRCGVAMRTASACETFFKWAGELQPDVVIVDLNSANLDLLDAVGRLRGLAKPPQRIVAFGPHVDENKHGAAKAAGCDEVLARGAFLSRLNELLNCPRA